MMVASVNGANHAPRTLRLVLVRIVAHTLTRNVPTTVLVTGLCSFHRSWCDGIVIGGDRTSLSA